MSGALRGRRSTRAMMAWKGMQLGEADGDQDILGEDKAQRRGDVFLVRECGVTGTEMVKTPSSYCRRLENSISSSCSRGGMLRP